MACWEILEKAVSYSTEMRAYAPAVSVLTFLSSALLHPTPIPRSPAMSLYTNFRFLEVGFGASYLTVSLPTQAQHKNSFSLLSAS